MPRPPAELSRTCDKEQKRADRAKTLHACRGRGNCKQYALTGLLKRSHRRTVLHLVLVLDAVVVCCCAGNAVPLRRLAWQLAPISSRSSEYNATHQERKRGNITCYPD